MSSFVKNYDQESNLWVAVDDGVDTMYFPLAETSFSYNSGGNYWGEASVDSSSYAIDDTGSERKKLSWLFNQADIIEYTQVP